MAFLTLTRGYVAIVDDEDLHHLKQWSWCVLKNKDLVYALRRQNFPSKRINRMLHHEVLRLPLPQPLPPGYVVDHINHDPLDCRKQNLRICTVAQNNWNCRPRRNKKTSKYKGLTWARSRRRWQVSIQHNKVKRSLGYFKYEYPALYAYNEAAQLYHGTFAYRNLWDGPTPHHGDPDHAPPVFSPRLHEFIKKHKSPLGKSPSSPSTPPGFSPYLIKKTPGIQLLFNFM